MPDTFFSGLLRDQEDHAFLASGRAFAGTGNKLAYPPEFDPRGIIRVENQGSFNSCVGHGLSSCGEACAYLDSGGTLKVQFSRWGAYIWSQQEGGMVGRDNGATITGAVKAAVKYGFCPEEIWPYPTRYSVKVPAEAVAAAAPFQLLAHTPIRSYDQGFEWMNQGKGPLLIGIDWTKGLADNTGDVTLGDLGGRTLGGHCMFLWGWLSDGRLWLGNSHSPTWGQAGWRPTRPEVLDRWCRNGEVFGLSDLKDVKESRPVICDFGEEM